MAHGCRSYLAVAGGIDVPGWRGSRSTDVNARLGPVPRPLEADDELPVGRPTVLPATPVDWSLDPRPWFDVSSSRRIRLLPGSHTDRLDATSRECLTGETFHIGNDSNRVGVRLDGPLLEMAYAPATCIEVGVTDSHELHRGYHH